jgi:hypothetical protein
MNTIKGLHYSVRYTAIKYMYSIEKKKHECYQVKVVARITQTDKLAIPSSDSMRNCITLNKLKISLILLSHKIEKLRVETWLKWSHACLTSLSSNPSADLT